MLSFYTIDISSNEEKYRNYVMEHRWMHCCFSKNNRLAYICSTPLCDNMSMTLMKEYFPNLSKLNSFKFSMFDFIHLKEIYETNFNQDVFLLH